jgi:hypothetical protein
MLAHKSLQITYNILQFVWLHIPTGVGIDKSVSLRSGWPDFDSRQWQEIFFCATESRPALGPTKPPIQWVPRTLVVTTKIILKYDAV